MLARMQRSNLRPNQILGRHDGVFKLHEPSSQLASTTLLLSLLVATSGCGNAEDAASEEGVYQGAAAQITTSPVIHSPGFPDTNTLCFWQLANGSDGYLNEIGYLDFGPGWNNGNCNAFGMGHIQVVAYGHPLPRLIVEFENDSVTEEELHPVDYVVSVVRTSDGARIFFREGVARPNLNGYQRRFDIPVRRGETYRISARAKTRYTNVWRKIVDRITYQ